MLSSLKQALDTCILSCIAAQSKKFEVSGSPVPLYVLPGLSQLRCNVALGLIRESNKLVTCEQQHLPENDSRKSTSARGERI